MKGKEMYCNIFNEIADHNMKELGKSDIVGKRTGESKVFRMAMASKVAAAFAIFMLAGGTVFAAQLFMQKLSINGTALPELDRMEVVSAQRLDATEDEMQKALYAAAADFVFKDFPDGLDTAIGEGGLGISEGQAQRIAIARSFLRPGKVILMDEPTSALDAETDRKSVV